MTLITMVPIGDVSDERLIEHAMARGLLPSGIDTEALFEASARVQRGDLDEAVIWIERAIPGLDGLVRLVATRTRR